VTTNDALNAQLRVVEASLAYARDLYLCDTPGVFDHEYAVDIFGGGGARSGAGWGPGCGGSGQGQGARRWVAAWVCGCVWWLG
jgi:hypothetical protein